MWLYRVTDWDAHFENNRSRDIQDLTWVPFPNKHDGDGYTELIDHPDGPSHFAAWVLIVQVASRCRPRGTLLRSAGLPHDSQSLSRMTRMKPAIFDKALPRLVEIGWLERTPHLGAVKPQAPAVELQAGAWNGMEWNGIEGKETRGRAGPEMLRVAVPSQLDQPAFLAAWSEWLAYRRECRLSVRDRTMRAQMDSLAPLGPIAAAECLRMSIRNGWAGIFPEKAGEGRGGKATPRRAEQLAADKAAIAEASAQAAERLAAMVRERGSPPQQRLLPE